MNLPIPISFQFMRPRDRAEGYYKRSESQPPSPRMSRLREFFPSPRELRPRAMDELNFLTYALNKKPEFQLCTKCKSVVFDDLLHEDFVDGVPTMDDFSATGYKLYESFWDLLESALNYCPLCRIILIEMAVHFQNRVGTQGRGKQPFPQFFTGVNMTWMTEKSARPVYLALINYGDPFEIGILHYKLATLQTETPDSVSRDLLPFRSRGRPVSIDPLGQTAIDFMCKSLSTCLNDHVGCSSTQPDNPVLPTRVIDVGDDIREPRLFISEGSQGHWVAVSYCWGGVRDYVTEKHTLSERIKGMPLADLPNAFRDAIIITRRLGIPYLWIDAVCIIQDDFEVDWPNEANHMHEYYRYSKVTLSVVNGSSSRDHILKPRKPKFNPLNLMLDSKKLGWKGEVTLRPSKHYYLDNFFDFNYNQLHTRGWCCQEYHLPPRTLHFTTQGMAWECLGHTSLEWDHEAVPNTSKSDRLSTLTGGKISWHPFASDIPQNASQPLSVHSSPSEVHKKWRYVVEGYSTRTLSFASDKLTALSGLASLFHDMLLDKDRYLAGLWENDLLKSLNWRISHPKAVYPAKYRAPSWSWAALDTPIQTDELYLSKPEIVQRCIIKEAHVKQHPQQPFGAVLGGHLRISAPWFMVYFDAFPPPEWKETERDDMPNPDITNFKFFLPQLDPAEWRVENGVPVWSGHSKVEVEIPGKRYDNPGQSKDKPTPTDKNLSDTTSASPSGVNWANITHGQEESTESSNPTPGRDDNSVYVSTIPSNNDPTFDTSPFYPPGTICTPDVKWDVIPSSDTFMDADGRLVFAMLMICDDYFMILQPNLDIPGTFRRIGLAVLRYRWRGKFDDEYLEKITREVVIT